MQMPRKIRITGKEMPIKSSECACEGHKMMICHQSTVPTDRDIPSGNQTRKWTIPSFRAEVPLKTSSLVRAFPATFNSRVFHQKIP